MEGRLARFKSFNSEFENEIGKHQTYQEAYHATEQKFKEKVGFNQYSGWDSFKNLRSRNLKKKKR
jgi:hypothetical protein